MRPQTVFRSRTASTFCPLLRRDQTGAPTRFARQLLSILPGIAATRQSESACAEDLALVQRVALDCIPAQRRLVLIALAQQDADDALSTSMAAQKERYPTDNIRRALEDCQALGLVSVTKKGDGRANIWSLHDEWRETLAAMLEGDTTHDDGDRVKPETLVEYPQLSPVLASVQPTSDAEVEAI